ncbi:ribonuclease D [Monaibacterium marinum]|uniref:Ribonuclease D n=1 Tax=Pontivivens marinum TaxID=1690039 RepID=A0A2C9CT31_9RHOB|nr:ribonuclease D [Monaibacterium marinum]SOH93529.1 ribonuclease D [Monaibacterium marinum]
MLEITTTEALATFCAEAAKHPYVTVDTEFLRERTYYAQLCLVQIAYPGTGPETAAIVDVLVDGLDLTPMFELMQDQSVVKVFHAARQDLEIFWQKSGALPVPLFDTQVAAMVCGFGEQVGYETLVRSICKAGLDKSSRFTDWSRRPLSGKQKTYAVGDVTYLRDIYEHLAEKIAKSGRERWVTEELGVLTNPDTYRADPKDAWKRLKTRSSAPRFLAVARGLAEWREAEAQDRDIPRSRLMKDDALLEVASNRPTNVEDLGKSRLLLREARKGRTADAILEVVRVAMAIPDADLPRADERANSNAQASPALMDLLKVLLKAQSERTGVAQKLIATMPELEAYVLKQPEGNRIRTGWRHEIFGSQAADLIEGRIALGVRGKTIDIVEIEQP